jgi:hypothetical protein
MGKNPYRYALKSASIKERILTGVYLRLVPFFSGQNEWEEAEDSGIRLIALHPANTVEWELNQGTSELLAEDFKKLINRLTPYFIRRSLNDLRRYFELFLVMDDDLVTMRIPEGLQASQSLGAIRLTQDNTLPRAANRGYVTLLNKKAIQFRDAVRIMMMRSVYRMRKLPKLLLQVSTPFYNRNLLKFKTYGLFSRPLALVKNILILISNKRN